MQLIEVEKLLRTEPFRPFRMCMSDGAEYLVSNPNWVFVTRRVVMVGVGEESDVIPRSAEHYDPMHMTRIEFVDADPP